MRFCWTGEEFWMKLATNHKWMVFELNYFDKITFWKNPRDF